MLVCGAAGPPSVSHVFLPRGNLHPSEIYASGGSSLVALINAPTIGLLDLVLVCFFL